MMTVLPPSITQSSDTKPPQPLDDTLLHAFAVETNALLTGAKCQKIHQLTPYDFVLSVWQPNPTQCPILAAHQHLLITLRKDAPFVCWLNATEFQQLQSLYGTGRNTPLVALLRKQLLGARLENIACIAGEPILHLHLTTTIFLFGCGQISRKFLSQSFPGPEHQRLNRRQAHSGYFSDLLELHSLVLPQVHDQPLALR